MKGKDELQKFKKMWTWLMAYPAHDREYYMKHVAKESEEWANNCPLSNNTIAAQCNGCQLLWEGSEGTLCTDPSSPLFRWMTTERIYPDTRSFYARQLALLAMDASRRPRR